MKTKFLASVMVLGVVSSNGDVMPPHVFGDKETVNAKAYIRILDGGEAVDRPRNNGDPICLSTRLCATKKTQE